jgi:hypothetical protein
LKGERVRGTDRGPQSVQLGVSRKNPLWWCH